MEGKCSVPPELSFEDQVFALNFHPHADVLAVGMISGEVFLYVYHSLSLAALGDTLSD